MDFLSTKLYRQGGKHEKEQTREQMFGITRHTGICSVEPYFLSFPSKAEGKTNEKHA